MIRLLFQCQYRPRSECPDYVEDDNWGCLYCDPDDNYGIVSFCNNKKVMHVTADKDAHLIAAAPEMYQFIKEMVADHDGFTLRHRPRAKALLKKAEGI